MAPPLFATARTRRRDSLRRLLSAVAQGNFTPPRAGQYHDH